jgi:hypothetical protein
MNPESASADKPASLALAFAPVHKLALGIAVGLVTGALLFAVTAFHVAMQPGGELELGLLAQYFYGFDVSWRGAFVALGWGFVTGFVGGWFVAFVRNLIVTIIVFTLRTKAELEQTSDFLDHI